MLSLLRSGCKQTNSSNPFWIGIFLFLSYSFGLKTINTFIHSVVASIPYPIPDQNGQSWSDPFSDQNSAKTLPDGAAHTYITYIREYPPGRVPMLYVLSYVRVPDSGTWHCIQQSVSQRLCMLVLWIWPNKCGDCGVESSESCLLWW